MKFTAEIEKKFDKKFNYLRKIGTGLYLYKTKKTNKEFIVQVGNLKIMFINGKAIKTDNVDTLIKKTERIVA